MTFSNTINEKDGKVLAVIPARLQSTRLPEKPLANILGKPMIQWVYEKTCKASLIHRTVVATDSEKIKKAVESFGGEAIMTSPDHQSGTDRLVEVAKAFKEYDTIINVQGDEPMIDPHTLDYLISKFSESECTTLGTLAKAPQLTDEILSPNSAKVVVSKKNKALYFSRSPIPFSRDQKLTKKSSVSEIKNCNYLIHIGIYIYKREFLLKFPHLESSVLEQTEKLEQLRVLENDYPIVVFQTKSSSIGVDTMEDLEQVRELMTKENYC